MTDFKLDTSGTVRIYPMSASPAAHASGTWNRLSPFAQGYVEALFASLQDRLCGASVTTSPGVGARRFSSKAVGQGGCTRTASFILGRHFYCAQHAKEAPTPLRTASGKLRAGVRPIPVAYDMLAPETVARIMEDCDARRGLMDINSKQLGRWFWERHQAGEYQHLPPLTVSLGDDGKVYLSDATDSLSHHGPKGRDR